MSIDVTHVKKSIQGPQSFPRISKGPNTKNIYKLPIYAIETAGGWADTFLEDNLKQ